MYKKVEKKVDTLELKKSSADTEMIEVIKNTLLGFFGDNKVEEK